jgi:hypothetical protein
MGDDAETPKGVPMSRVAIEVLDMFEYRASVELILWPESVVVWFVFRSWGMGDRQVLRDWLAAPAAPLMFGDVNWQLEDGKVSLGIGVVLPKRPLSERALADLRRGV